MRRYRMPALRIHRSAGTLAYCVRLYGRAVRLGAVSAMSREEAETRFAILAEQDLREHPFGVDSLTRVRTTGELYRTQHYGARGDNNHSIAVASTLDLPEADLPVPPYTLGAWLGDGHSASALLTNSDADSAIVEYIRAEGITARRRAHSDGNHIGSYQLGSYIGSGKSKQHCLQAVLRRLGVLGNKHIPLAYLRASCAQRLALLQGLMDTDGTASKAGQCVFCNINERLARNVFHLVATLGLKPTLSQAPAKLYGKACGTAYKVGFFAYRGELEPFRLERKRARSLRWSQ